MFCISILQKPVTKKLQLLTTSLRVQRLAM